MVCKDCLESFDLDYTNIYIDLEDNYTTFCPYCGLERDIDGQEDELSSDELNWIQINNTVEKEDSGEIL